MRWTGAGATGVGLAHGVCAVRAWRHCCATGVVAASDPRPRSAKQDGQDIFRFDTFGDEQLWTSVLRMHEVLAAVRSGDGARGGPEGRCRRAAAGGHRRRCAPAQVDLHDPAVTVALLRLECGRRRQGHGQRTRPVDRASVSPARSATRRSTIRSPRGSAGGSTAGRTPSLNVGAIVALSPALDDATKAEFRTWGPGKYDPRHHAFDGTNIIPLNSPSLPIVIPSIYGLQGVGFETVHRGRSDLVLEQLRRRRADGRPRQLQRSAHRPVHPPDAGPGHAETAGAARLSAESARRRSRRRGSVDQRRRASAASELFSDAGACSTCHQGPTFTDVLSGPDRTVPLLHDAGGSRHGPALRGSDPRRRSVSDDTAARAVAARAVLPRRQRADVWPRSSSTTIRLFGPAG